MGPWFSWLLGVAASTKPDFGFLLTLNVKNMMYLGDGDIWLELVESFSNLGLHFSRELLTVEPARRGTGHQTILKSSNKALTSNARTHPLHTSSLRKHPFLQTSPAAKGEVNVRNECFRRLSHIFFSGFLRYRYWSNRTINEFPPRGEKNSESSCTVTDERGKREFV